MSIISSENMDNLKLMVPVLKNLQSQMSDKDMETVLMVVICVNFILVFLMFYLMRTH